MLIHLRRTMCWVQASGKGSASELAGDSAPAPDAGSAPSSAAVYDDLWSARMLQRMGVGMHISVSVSWSTSVSMST